MRIVELISRDRIVASLTATSKQAILEELATHLSEAQPSLDKKELVRVLVDRESLASTAIGRGVAIPHGKLADVDEIVACIGRAKNGIDFDSIDGKPTFLFFVMVAPENSTGAHLKALARISRMFRDEDFKERLLGAADGDAMFELIGKEDEKY